jgi:hypothetical protein
MCVLDRFDLKTKGLKTIGFCLGMKKLTSELCMVSDFLTSVTIFILENFHVISM